ncbi:hypothetical protein ILYODFUR_027723 [Ilyodon furcidens]|uniref:Uncharacterized protein n=1 Tax=Ilyodon furcidens TaxID=33524 RepID=A0ABV0TEK9_9TELE
MTLALIRKHLLLCIHHERKTSTRFTGRCSVASFIIPPRFLPAGAQFARAASGGLSGDQHLVQSNSVEIFFQDGAGAMSEVVKKGNAVRGRLFVVASFAGVLPFTVKACCLILQPAGHLVALAERTQQHDDDPA